MRRYRKIIGLILLNLSIPAFSQIEVISKNLMPSGKGTTLLYVNGQANIEKDTIDTKNLIFYQISINNLQSEIDYGSKINVEYIFNETFGVNEEREKCNYSLSFTR